MEDCKHLEAHEQRFCQVENEAKTKVSWVVFVWAVGILTAAMMLGANYISSIADKVNSSNVEMAKIQTKLSSIEVSLIEIKVLLKEHSNEK